MKPVRLGPSRRRRGTAAAITWPPNTRRCGVPRLAAVKCLPGTRAPVVRWGSGVDACARTGWPTMGSRRRVARDVGFKRQTGSGAVSHSASCLGTDEDDSFTLPATAAAQDTCPVRSFRAARLARAGALRLHRRFTVFLAMYGRGSNPQGPCSDRGPTGASACAPRRCSRAPSMRRDRCLPAAGE